jgi:hypothetical protein
MQDMHQRLGDLHTLNANGPCTHKYTPALDSLQRRSAPQNPKLMPDHLSVAQISIQLQDLARHLQVLCL